MVDIIIEIPAGNIGSIVIIIILLLFLFRGQITRKQEERRKRKSQINYELRRKKVEEDNQRMNDYFAIKNQQNSQNQEIYSLEDMANGELVKISIYGMGHFCIHHESPLDLLKEEYTIINLSEVRDKDKIEPDFYYLNNDYEENKFVLLTNLNGWSYFLWDDWDFDNNLTFARELSDKLHTTVNYYFVDPVLSHSEWILAKGGVISRAYYRSHGKMIYDKGFCQAEVDLKEWIKEEYTESFFYEVYEKTCVPAPDYIKRSELLAFTGAMKMNQLKM